MQKVSSNSKFIINGVYKPLRLKKKRDLKPRRAHLETNMKSGALGDLSSSGFYILPFAGLFSAENLALKAFSSDYEIEEAIGVSHGISLGYEGKNFFSDIQISTLQNRMKNIDYDIPFSGDTKGFGIHLIGGGRINLNQKFSCLAGAGIGGVKQDMSILIAGTLTEEEKEIVLSYQIFTGFEVQLLDSIKIGLRYRWLNIEEMNLFSDRNLHLFELSLAYLL